MCQLEHHHHSSSDCFAMGSIRRKCFQITFAFIIFAQLYSVTGMDEFCEGETFRAKCRSDEVIFTESAYYGRMRLGRCVKLDMGYLGCGEDVLDLADKRCSGKQQCQISIPDTEFETTRPCLELKSYLEISTTCLQVTTASPRVCHSSKFIKVTSPHGYLSSTVTSHTSCGSQTCPWVLEASVGQKVNLTLLDFGAAARKQNQIDTNDVTAQIGEEHEACQEYAIIREVGSAKSMSICGSTRRQTNVYLSQGNQLEIYLTPKQNPDGTPLNYIIEYEAVGCPMLSLPEHYEILTQSPERAMVKCVETEELTQLECRGTKWIGNIKNCVTTEDTPKASHRVSIGAMSMPYAVAVAVIVAVAIVIGMAVLTVGLVMFRRRRQHRSSCRKTKSTHSGISRTASMRSTPIPTSGTDTFNNQSEKGTLKQITPIKQKLPPTTTGTSGRKGKYTHIWQMPLPVPGGDSPA